MLPTNLSTVPLWPGLRALVCGSKLSSDYHEDSHRHYVHVDVYCHYMSLLLGFIVQYLVICCIRL